MNAKLDVLLRFWDLAARHTDHGLSQSEEVEYFALLQLVVDDLDRPTPHQGRPEASATLIGNGSIVAAHVLTLAAGGILVRAEIALEVGASVMLCIAEPERNTEVTLPCRVSWLDRPGSRVMALLVDGAPVREARENAVRAPLLGALSVPSARGSRPSMAA